MSAFTKLIIVLVVLILGGALFLTLFYSVVYLAFGHMIVNIIRELK